MRRRYEVLNYCCRVGASRCIAPILKRILPREMHLQGQQHLRKSFLKLFSLGALRCTPSVAASPKRRVIKHEIPVESIRIYFTVRAHTHTHPHTRADEDA